MKKLAIFDIDGTLFRWQLYHELVFRLKDLGYFNEADALDLDTALKSWQSKQVSWHDYEMTVINTYTKYLSRIQPADLRTIAKDIVTQSGHKIYNYTLDLLQRLQKQGYYTLALSGSQQEIAEEFAKQYGFDDAIGATFHEVNGRFANQPKRIVHGKKDTIITKYLSSHPELTLEASIAVGDSGGDISMLELVDQPIAFNPAEELLDVALKNNWHIVIERKNIAYTLQKETDGHVILAQTNSF